MALSDDERQQLWVILHELRDSHIEVQNRMMELNAAHRKMLKSIGELARFIGPDAADAETTEFSVEGLDLARSDDIPDS